jgi:uncharacterized protein (TIGR03083 family)
MATIRQFYGEAGVPLHVEGDLDWPASAWRSQRTRVRAWLDSVPDLAWSGPTRCELWDMTLLVRHLASGSQFLGYTLHKAATGSPTSLLQGFDPHQTVQAAAAMLGDMTPGAARDSMKSMDASVDGELAIVRDAGWSAMAEAPPGQLPAHLAVSHFLFDSWVHEYDLMLPLGEKPTLDTQETEVVVRYLVGLATIATGADVPLDLRLTDPDLRIGLDVVDGVVMVTVGSAPSNAAAIEARAVDLVDRTTGRESGPVHGDYRALAVLDEFAALLAG